MNLYKKSLIRLIKEIQSDVDSYRASYEGCDSYPKKSGAGQALATIIECKIKAIEIEEDKND